MLAINSCLGSVAYANIEVNFYKDNKIIAAHGIDLAPLVDGSVVCVEPQKDSVWLVNKPEFGFGADSMKIRCIQF